MPWDPEWRDTAGKMPCGNCLGRECGHCSINTGEADGVDGLPTSYVPKAILYHEAETHGSATALAAPDVHALASPNPIVLENQNAGTPENQWLIGAADATIEGFAAQFSLNRGQTVNFKIKTDSVNYRIQIFRLGYYSGNGARLMATINRTLATPQVQPAPTFNAPRRLVDAGNWAVSASWAVPATAVSGIYIALLTRFDGSQGRNIIPFIVRDDANASDIIFQTSDTTWQAYNWWGGYNLYGGVAAGGRAGRSSAVSYNRPIITRDGGFASGPQDFIFSVEYPAIRWLERNGYHVKYIAGVDVASTPQRLSGGKIFLSVGHDEYWSADQRNNVASARDAGLHLAFLSGNEVYWQTRWEQSIDGSATPFKTMVCYKERWDNENSDAAGTTSTWRDSQYGSGSEENGLTGTLFTVDSYRLDSIEVPFAQSNLRFWRNTAVANISSGQVYTLTQNLLGYEWDSDLDNRGRRSGLINLSSTTLNVNTMLLDYGVNVGNGTAHHALTLYRAASGAWVFGAGTVYWCWGLDENHDNEDTPTDPNVQQSMVNLFADMGVQPQTLMPGLVAAAQTTDVVAPTSAITSPLTSGSFSVGMPIVVTGTASDGGGGLVASVEVSTDGGTTWRRATGLENWSFVFTPLSAGSYTLRSRAIDDSLNIQTPGAGITINVAAASLVSLFGAAETPAVLVDPDPNFVTLGVRFTSSQQGTIVALKYFKGIGDGGIHTGAVWNTSGALLASAKFTRETASGWQIATLHPPLAVSAGVTYVAGFGSHGHYTNTSAYFSAAKVSGPLTAPTGNGYYTYSQQLAYPTTASNGTNYWMDIVFRPTSGANQPPVAVDDTGFQVVQNTPLAIPAASLLGNDTDPNGNALSITAVSNPSGGTVSYNAGTSTVTFTPTNGYIGPAAFTYTVSDGLGGSDTGLVSLTVVTSPMTTQSLFPSNAVPTTITVNDPNPVELGMKFSAASNGNITGIRFYKGSQNTGAHTGRIWSSAGALLGTATFTNETPSGWQTALLPSAVQITAGTTYVVSYHSNGFYSVTGNYFTTAVTNGSLTAPASASSGGNGVYAYGPAGGFPTNTYNLSNYWVDVLFTPAGQV